MTTTAPPAITRLTSSQWARAERLLHQADDPVYVCQQLALYYEPFDVEHGAIRHAVRDLLARELMRRYHELVEMSPRAVAPL